jgi:hypothetical protein
LIPIFIALSVTPILSASAPAWPDVARLLHRHCADCHRPGQAAPFPLLSYEDAKPRARQIAEVTRLRHMPPWKATAPAGAFRGERRLTQAEIARLAAWAKAGAPQGNGPSPTPPSPPAELPGGLTLTMPRPFTVPAAGPDLYECFVIPAAAARNRWVRAVTFRPGASRVVHHALVFAGRPEKDAYSCFGAPGFVPARGLGGWSPGQGTFEFPAGTAALLPAGHNVVLQIHYHPSGTVEQDQSSVTLHFQPDPPERRLIDIPLGTNAIDIPAGQAGYSVKDSFTLPVDVDLLGVIPHMHYVGKVVRGRAGPRLLIEIRDWDFNWQDRYWYRQPIRLKAGTRLTAEFMYDNSAGNVRNPSNPPRRVTWGFGVNDEMAGLHWQVSPVRLEDAEQLGQALWGKMMRWLGAPAMGSRAP